MFDNIDYENSIKELMMFYGLDVAPWDVQDLFEKGNFAFTFYVDMYKEETKEYCSCFSGQTVNFNDEEFTGCDISAVFGGVKCDLRNAIIKEDVLINASSIFGGITILVPKDINVKISSTSIFLFKSPL